MLASVYDMVIAVMNALAAMDNYLRPTLNWALYIPSWMG